MPISSHLIVLHAGQGARWLHAWIQQPYPSRMLLQDMLSPTTSKMPHTRAPVKRGVSDVHCEACGGAQAFYR